jgi:hypothetical protein
LKSQKCQLNREPSLISGFLAWLFVHLWYLIEFDNKFLVFFQWAWNYFTRKCGARLITGDNPLPVVNGVPAGLGNGNKEYDLT